MRILLQSAAILLQYTVHEKRLFVRILAAGQGAEVETFAGTEVLDDLVSSHGSMLSNKTTGCMRDRSENAPKEHGAEDHGQQNARCAAGWLRRSSQPGKTMAYERRG